VSELRTPDFRTAQAPTGRVVKTVRLESASAQEIGKLVGEVSEADLVVMIVGAGNDAHAAAIIGEACSARRVMTHTFIVGAGRVSDAALSRTLTQVRPWSLMVVVLNDDDYVDDILRSFR
jgi:hypothetical protein